MLTEHKGICLKINGKRTVRLKKVLLSLRIVLSKHMVHLKFMLILSLFFKTVKSNEKASGSYTEKKMKITFLVVFLINLFVLIINLGSQVVLYRGENTANKFIKAILEEHDYYKKVMKKYFSKNLIMPEEDEEKF